MNLIMHNLRLFFFLVIQFNQIAKHQEKNKDKLFKKHISFLLFKK